MELKASEISIDMLDLIVDVNSYIFSREIKHILDIKIHNNDLEYYENFSNWKSYRHNFIYKKDDYSFYFAYQSNIPGLENRFYLSFNPNKVDADDEMLAIVINFIIKNINSANIYKFDVAFDYDDIKTSDIIIDKSNYREHHTRRYSNNSEPTEYLGNDKVKIYDKAAEMVKKNPKLKKGEKTRIEYRIKEKIPLLYLSGYKCIDTMCNFNLRQNISVYDDNSLSPKEKFLVYSIENGYPLNKVSWKDKKKYQEIKSKEKSVYTELKPNQLEIEKALKKYISTLLSDYNYNIKTQ